MAGKSLPDSKRLSLLRAVSAIPVDADADEDLLGTFLPGPQYSRALDRTTLVIRGERGAGKTALFHLLQLLQTRGVPLSAVIPGAPDGRRVTGFSERGLGHPTADAVGAFASTADDAGLRALWLGHLAGRLIAEGTDGAGFPDGVRSAWERDLHTPRSWTQLVQRESGAVWAWLDTVERRSEETLFVVYDHLDRVAPTDRRSRERVTSALLSLWLSLSQRYDRLRGKILVREDLFSATVTSFADATKLESRSVRLEWPAGRLYALLVRRMLAHPELREWMEEVAQTRVVEDDTLGALPDPLELDDPSQDRFATALVGRFMGSGPTKGFAHRWMINHLRDARGIATPRSLLELVRGAAARALEDGPRAGYRRLLHPSELQAALVLSSRRRVREQLEDYPVVGRLANLEGKTLFLSRTELRRSLATLPRDARPGSGDDDGFDERGDEVLEELLRLGVIADRGGDRFDIPDAYRHAFGIKRRGGPRTAS